MTDSPAPFTPPPEPVGQTLARLRKRRKLTGQALGDLVGMSQTKISRLETGVIAADPGDVRVLAEALGMSASEIEDVVDRAERADNQLVEWTSAAHDLAASQREYGQMEASARELRILNPAVVPGLLQTSEYARALLSDLAGEAGEGPHSGLAVSEAVNARMQRNALLHESQRDFHFLINEQVLRNQVCEPAEMIVQIDRMRELASHSNVDLRIVTDDTRLPIVPVHGFVVADERWVSIDLLTGGLKSYGRKIVQTYRHIFDVLEAVGVTAVDPILDRYRTHYIQMLLPDAVTN